jgi:hypothetical protein
MTAVSVSDHVQAVVDHLNDAALDDGWSPDPATFGLGVPPASYGWTGTPSQSPFQGYGIVWQQGSQHARNLSLDDDARTQAFVSVFIRTFGGFQKQAIVLADLVHARMMDWTLTVPGRRLVSGGGIRFDVSQSPRVSEDVEYTMFEAGATYQIRTVPEE